MTENHSRQLPCDAVRLRHLAGELITNIRELGQAGWTPATSSNFSERIDAEFWLGEVHRSIERRSGVRR